MKFIIYERDSRDKAISQYLLDKGHIKLYDNELSKADAIILPFKNVEENVVIDEDFFKSLEKNVKVFTGVKNDILKEKFIKRGIKYFQFMDFKEISILNSIPTAEGVIYNLIGEMDRCILNSKILVIGYGICGRVITEKLKYLGAEVDIIEISDEKRAEASIKGILWIDENQLSDKCYDCIINTVPTKVLTTNTLKNINENTLVFDIASYPYGFNEKELKEMGIRYKRLTSLPSKFGVKYSGEILGDFIIKNV